ncbi:MAG TPA: hypothetical protein VLA12_14780, partial [Planctomycetaceae bacterium]|nr:hypothetical protein [Planctomycetaceae bacterium]
MILSGRLAASLALALLVTSAQSVCAENLTWSVEPTSVALTGNFEQAQLIVGQLIDGKRTDASIDGTQQAQYQSADESIALVDAQGRVRAAGNGTTQIKISTEGTTLEVPVTISNVSDAPNVQFIRDIAPILSK